MAIFRNEQDIEILREAGRRLAFVVGEVAKKAVPGVSEEALDLYAEELILKGGDKPAFKGYRPSGARAPYPSTICIQTNDKVVHGIPTGYILKEGDIVVIDTGLEHKGFFTDMAITIPIGKVDAAAKKLITTTRDALYAGIKEARAGNRLGDIGASVEAVVKKTGFSIVPEFGGHGIGKKQHEDPFVANYGRKKTGPLLEEGLVIAIEPIVNEGSPEVIFEKDGYTVRTKDGKRSAQFEHTILITKGDPEIITDLKN
ncbi:MAG: type I methionyl aminopeptidase [Parcubacteria group bacterium]|nr:type I methionyl aminopeptidase [Parcubacteria group bacterium]